MLKKITQKFISTDIKVRAVFIHIPKTGGTTFNKILKDEKLQFVKTINHDLRDKNFKYYYEYKDLENLFSFAFLRNPVDRAISAFYYLNNNGIPEYDSEDAARFILPYKGDFNAFVQTEFPKKEIFNQIHFKPQHEWIYDSNHNLCVDYIASFNNFELEITKILKLFGVSQIDIPRKNQGSKRTINIPLNIKKIISSYYEKDQQLFDNLTLLNKDIS